MQRNFQAKTQQNKRFINERVVYVGGGGGGE